MPKALVPFRGEALVRRGVRLLRAGGCAPVLVVVGAAHHRVADLLADVDVTVVHNPAWSTGMGGSLRAGLRAARDGAAAAAVVALVDQPLMGPDAVRRLVSAWREGAVVAVATYAGRPRNPVLFDRSAWDEAERHATGDAGARALLRDRPEWVQPVACDAVASPVDIDTEDDLRALMSRPDPNPAPDPVRSAAKEQLWN